MSASISVQADFLKFAQSRIQQDLTTALNAFDLPEPLKSSIYHAVMLGGKRVRPALCYATANLQGQAHQPAIRRAAVAVELIHCYSLVHDDLPCMDDDALRRGKPTCHVAFGEDTALLTGDLLQSMAYEVLSSQLFSESQKNDPAITLKQIQILATASSKMVCGQTLDLQSEGKKIDQTQLETIHRNKTGALIQASMMMSAVVLFQHGDEALLKLRQFGQAIGLAFQVQDDILDIISDTTVLGKTAGKDVEVEKSTYPALMGLEQAKKYANQLHDEALDALGYFAENATDLYAITQFLLKRTY